nr:hypothetical protein CFP56_20894 [Quercus suber]
MASVATSRPLAASLRYLRDEAWIGVGPSARSADDAIAGAKCYTVRRLSDIPTGRAAHAADTVGLGLGIFRPPQEHGRWHNRVRLARVVWHDLMTTGVIVPCPTHSDGLSLQISLCPVAGIPCKKRKSLAPIMQCPIGRVTSSQAPVHQLDKARMARLPMRRDAGRTFHFDVTVGSYPSSCMAESSARLRSRCTDDAPQRESN